MARMSNARRHSRRAGLPPERPSRPPMRRETARMRSTIISLPPPVRAPIGAIFEGHLGFQVEDLPDLRARIRCKRMSATTSSLIVFVDRKSAISSATWEPLRRFPRADLESPHADMAMEEVKRRAERNIAGGRAPGLSLALSVLPASQAPQFRGPALRCLHSLSGRFPLLGSHNVSCRRLGSYGWASPCTPRLTLTCWTHVPIEVRPLMYQGLTHGLQFAQGPQPLLSHLACSDGIRR